MIFIWSSKYCVSFNLRYIFNLLQLAILFQRFPTLWNSTLKITMLFRHFLTLLISTLKYQYQPKHNVGRMFKYLPGKTRLRKIIWKLWAFKKNQKCLMKDFFPCINIRPWTLTIQGYLGKDYQPTSFIDPWTLRNLFLVMHLRLLYRVLNCSTCDYKTDTGGDLSISVN